MFSTCLFCWFESVIAFLLYVAAPPTRGLFTPLMMGRPEPRNACFWDSPCLDVGQCVSPEPPLYSCSCYTAYLVQNETCSCGGGASLLCAKSMCAKVEDTCANGGTCRDTWGGYSCECGPGWQGDECQIAASVALRRFLPPAQLLFDPDAHTGVSAAFVLALRAGGLGDNFSAIISFGDGQVRQVRPSMMRLSKQLQLPLRSQHLRRLLPPPPLLAFVANRTFYLKNELVKVSLSVSNGDVVQYQTTLDLHVKADPRRCTPDVEVIDCGQTKEFVNPLHRSLKKRPRWYRNDRYVLRSRVTPDCWGADSTSRYTWRLCRQKGACLGTKRPQDESHFTVEEYSLSYGVYELTLTVDEVVDDDVRHVRSFHNQDRCVFDLTSAPLTAIIDGGFAISVTPGKTLVVNGSRSHDPNYPGVLKHLAFQWTCEAEEKFMNVCATVVDKNTHLVVPGKPLALGVVLTFTLVISDGLTKSTPVSQKVTVTTGHSPRLRVICLSNCAYNEPLDTEQTVALRVECLRYCEDQDNEDFYTWTLLDVPLATWKKQLFFGRNSRFFYLLGGVGVLQPETDYVVTVEAGIDKKTMRTVGLHMGRPPGTGHCDILPEAGVAGQTRFTLGCHNFDNFEHADMVYEFLQLDVGVRGDPGVLLEYGYNPIVTAYLLPGIAADSYVTIVQALVICGSGLRQTFNLTVTVKPPPFLVLPATLACDAILAPNKYAFHDTSEMVRQVMLVVELLMLLDETMLVGREACILKLLRDVPLLGTAAIVQVATSVRRLLAHDVFAAVKNNGNTAKVLRRTTMALASVVKERRFDGFVLYHARDVAHAIIRSAGAILDHVELPCSNRSADDYVQDYPVYGDINPACIESKLHNEKTMRDILITLSTMGRMLDKMHLVSDPIKKFISRSKNLYVCFRRYLPLQLPPSVDCSHSLTNLVQLSDSVRRQFSDYSDLPIGLLVAVISGDTFWWYRTGVSVSTSLLLVESPTLGPVPLDQPVQLMLNVSHPSGKGADPIHGTVTASEDWTDPDVVELKLKLHMVVADEGEVPLIIFEQLASDAPLRVVVTVGRRPTLEDFHELGVVLPPNSQQQRYVSREAAPKDNTFAYMALIPAEGSLGKDANFSMKVILTRCQHWEESQKAWSSEGCRVGNKTDANTVHCECYHMSVFSGRSLLLPRRKDVPVVPQVSLKNEIYPYVLIAVILLLLLFLVLLIVACLLARKRDARKEIIFLSDNIPGYTYAYLVGVYTGNKWNATSTSRVGFQIVGDRYKCRHHLLLGSRKPSSLVKNTDSWFVLLTRLDLGELRTLRLWHDHSGDAPSWYCSRVTVVDCQRDRQWTFLVEDWLTDGSTHLVVPVATSEELAAFKQQFPSQLLTHAKMLHPWVGILAPHKAALLWACVLVHMLVCILMFGFPQGGPVDTIDRGMGKPSPRHLEVIVVAGLTGFVVTLLLTLLFVKARPRSYKAVTLRGAEGVVDAGDLSRVDDARSLQPYRGASVPRRLESVAGQLLGIYTRQPLVFDNVLAYKEFPELETPVDQRRLRTYKLKGGADKRQYWFPHGVVYLAWALCVAVILVATALLVLCGLVYGKEESLAWAWTTLVALGFSGLLLFPLFIFVVAAMCSSPRVAKTRLDAVDAIGTLRIATDAHYPKEERELRAYLLKLNVLRSTDPYHPIDPGQARALRAAQRRRSALREALLDALLFALFLLLAYLMVALGRDPLLHWKTRVLREALQRGAAGLGVGDVGHHRDWLAFLETTAVPVLHETAQDDDMDVATPGWTEDHRAFLLGVPRMRQRRLTPFTCRFPAPMLDDTRHCNAEYSVADEDRKNHSFGWKVAALWSQDDETVVVPWLFLASTGSWPFLGHLASYGDGGYAALLGRTRVNSWSVVQFLDAGGWMDERWRAIMLDFVTFAPDRNLVGADFVVAERSAAGLVVVGVRCCAVALRPNGDLLEALLLVASLLLLALLLVLVWLQVLRFVRGGVGYYRRPWVCVDVACTVLAVVCVTLEFLSRAVRKRTLRKVEDREGNDFVGFEDACHISELLCFFLALLTGVATMRLWKLLSVGVRCELVDAVARAWRVPVLATLCFVLGVVATLAVSWHVGAAAESWEVRSLHHSVLYVLALTLGYGRHPQLHPQWFPLLGVATRLLLIAVVIAIVLLYFRNASYVFSRRPPQPSTLRRLVDALRIKKRKRRLRGGADVVKPAAFSVVVPRMNRMLDVAERRLLRAKRRLMASLALQGKGRLSAVALNAVAHPVPGAARQELFYMGFEVDGVARMVPTTRLNDARSTVQSLLDDVPSRTRDVEFFVASVPWENDFVGGRKSTQPELEWPTPTDVVAQMASTASAGSMSLSSTSSQSLGRLLTLRVAAAGQPSSSTSVVSCRCDTLPQVRIKVGAVDDPCCSDASQSSLNLVLSDGGDEGVRLVVAADDDQQLQGVRILVVREGNNEVKVLVIRR